MTTQIPPSYEEAIAEAKRLLAKPLSSEERIEYAKGAIEVLQDDKEIAKFERDIENVAKAAILIDVAFDRVTRNFQDMVDKYGGDFPELSNYKAEWDGYNERWVQYLWDSRFVASEMAAVLRRYDQVFLDLIQSIRTDQDRRDVITELTNFSNESHAAAALMAINFRNLEADIRGFDARFSTYLEQEGVKLAEEAKILQGEIDYLTKQIQSYNDMILAALGLMAAGLGLMGSGLPIIGFIAFVIGGTAAAGFLVARILDEKKLENKQAELRRVNEKQQDLAELQTQFDIIQPDIALICDQLVLFGDVWASVSVQCKVFSKHLEKGMEALDDEEFQLHVTLAKNTCTPLRNGLNKYAEAIIASPLQSKYLRLASK